MLTVRLPREIDARLAALARATGQTKSHFVRLAIVEHIDEIEAHAAADTRQGDDPFASFAEWDSAADRRAYGGL